MKNHLEPKKERIRTPTPMGQYTLIQGRFTQLTNNLIDRSIGYPLSVGRFNLLANNLIILALNTLLLGYFQ